MSEYLCSTLPSNRARLSTPDELATVVTDVAAHPSAWSGLVEFDLTRRHYARLRRDDSVEVWLICWDLGQDTLLHDHGGSAGAFTVVSGSLTEDHGSVHLPGLRTRRHTAGATVGFGADYLHNLVNVGTEPTVSVHAYSPPLRSMNFYCWLPTGMHHLREIACDTPEPDTAALETEAAALREPAR